ncbi:MAG: methylated-DNA--[protein]-cysteine S-methyltransferase [Silicimonas sp.]|nr:methylated-DNA--[protein]-cysteine S-methyltransferase [Silicimonas sp.]
MPSLSMDSPIGPLTLVEEDGDLTRLLWRDGDDDHTPLLDEAVRQLKRYFEGDLTRFTLPLAPKVTPSQQRFLDALCDIPYGETRTYGDMAKQLGISAQAAGQACGANPIGIIIPCHRVTGSTNLGGFSAPDGIEKKVALLKLEGAASLLI